MIERGGGGGGSVVFYVYYIHAYNHSSSVALQSRLG